MPDVASPSPLVELSDALADLVARAAPDIVAIHSHRSRSSGFVWRPGLIVTADEALAEDGDVSVILPGGTTLPAQVAGRDPTTDVALLRAPELPPAAIDQAPAPHPPGGLRAGALALAVGAHEGAPTASLATVTRVGGAWQSMRGGEIDALIELNVALRRSAEGCLVLDAAGRRLGMAVFGPRRRVLVIPAATIDRVAAALDVHGRMPRGYLGLAMQPVTTETGTGAMVMSVDASGPAASAGVRQGDVIVAWNGQPIGSLRNLMRGLGPDSIGTVVVLSLIRGGASVQAPVTISERPQA